MSWKLTTTLAWKMTVYRIDNKASVGDDRIGPTWDTYLSMGQRMTGTRGPEARSSGNLDVRVKN